MPTVYNDQTVPELLDDAAEAIRGVCHLTFNDGSLQYPSDAYNALATLATMSSRTSQAVRQVDRIVAGWVDNGYVTIEAGDFVGDPNAAAAATSVHLDEASVALNEAAAALNRAQAALGGAAWTGPDRD